MASCSQTQSDVVGGSVSAPQTTTNVSIGPSPTTATHNDIDHRHGSLPFMPPQVSPFQAVDAHRNRQNLPSTSVCDLNIPFDVNYDLDQNSFFANRFPWLDYQVSDFPHPAFDMTMDFGAPSNITNSNHAGNVFPQCEQNFDANTVSFGSARRSGVGDVNMTPTPLQLQHHAEMYRPPTNFRGSSLRRPNSNIFSRGYHNQVRVNSPQMDNVGRLDGRFLSLGCQSNPVNNTEYKGNLGHTRESPFSQCGHESNYLHDSMGERMAGFQNDVHDLQTLSNIPGDLTSAQRDSGGSHAVTPGFSVPPGFGVPPGFRLPPGFRVPPVPVLHTGQANMQQLMPTMGRETSDLRRETDPRASTSNPSGRRTRRGPFDASVLRSNHQHSADLLQRSHVESNVVPLPEETGGGILKQDKSDEGTEATVRNQHPSSSTTVTRETPKRSVEAPQQAMMQYQRRKITPQTSLHPFSTNLPQNALGRIPSGHPVPSFPTMIPTALPAASRAGPFIPLTQISEISSTIPSTVNSAPTVFANNSRPMLTPVRPHAPPTLMHPSAPTAPAALAGNVSHRTAVTRMPVPASGRVMGRSPSTVATPRMISMSPTNARLMSPAMASMRNYPHGFASTANPYPPYAALRSPPTTPHIKWQGSDAPPTLGYKCMLCKRDLSYAPEGPISIPRIPPPIAVLPCGHTFHDHCLQLIASDDQSKDPPCIPCALGDN